MRSFVGAAGGSADVFSHIYMYDVSANCDRSLKADGTGVEVAEA